MFFTYPLSHTHVANLPESLQTLFAATVAYHMQGFEVCTSVDDDKLHQFSA